MHVVPFLLLGLLLTGCSTQAPEARPADPPDRYEQAATYSATHAGDALVVWERGEVVLERGQNGFALDTPHMLASGTKTFAGIAALAAQADGLFSLDERVSTTIREWKDDPRRSEITVRQLLHLTSGLDPGASGQAPTFDAALDAAVLDAPGTTFRYGPVPFQAFGALLRRALDGEDPVPYYRRRILAPIGVTNDQWAYVDGQDPQLAGGARLTAREWLRVGRLLLNDGRWNGTRVLPPGALDTLAQPTEASPGYGYTVWLNAPIDTSHAFFDHAPPSLQPDGPDGMIYHAGPNDLVMAAGLFNQRLYVVPSREMVAVRFGRPDASWNDAEFLARLLDGRSYEAPARKRRPIEERVALLTTLRMTQLDRALRLTEAQETALRPHVERRLRAWAAFQQSTEPSGALNRRERRRLFRRLRTVHRETNRAIEAELTPGQVKTYHDIQAERRDRWRSPEGRER